MPENLGYRNYPSLNDSKRDGNIHAIALNQLHAYQTIADTWSLYPDDRARRCMECDENVYFATDTHGDVYTYTDEEIRSLKVAHIRQCHSEVINAREQE